MPRSTSTTQPTVQTLEDRLVPNALSGTVYADTNANRIFDAGEMGLANVQVQLDNASDGTPDVVVSTNAQGQYFFPFATAHRRRLWSPPQPMPQHSRRQRGSFLSMPRM